MAVDVLGCLHVAVAECLTVYSGLGFSYAPDILSALS
jgi:hypothetical protein